MKYAACLIAGCAALAACNSSPKVNEKNASVAEVAQKVQEAGTDQSFIRAGKWQSKVTIDKFEVPGMPADVAQRMQGVMAQQQAHSFESCVTQEDVKRPKADFFTGKNNECQYDHFTMGGGKIDALMHCPGKGGSGETTMQMAGTYSPESYQMQMATKVEPGAGGHGGVNMEMRVDSHRVGECSSNG